MAEDAGNDAVSPDHVQRLIAAAEQEAATISAILPPTPPRHSVPGYELAGELGRGGMGVVYRALQLSTKRIVALKVMLAGCFASPSTRVRFQREVELSARLQHPGIVRVLESGLTADGQPYYAMDYVDAAPLSQWLRVSQPDIPTILTTFVEICEAVQHAHQRDVIHRDLKPSNVLVDAEGKPHILDFGLAKATDRPDPATLAATVSSPGQILGTLRYLSPEQATGRPDEVDIRVDIYAVGAMLFEALTGSPPHDDTASPSEVIRSILEEQPQWPCSLMNSVDRELKTIILKALEKEKERRYQSAADLRDDIRRYLSGEPILAQPPSSLYRLRKKMAKHRLGLILAVIALALTIGGVSLGLWFRERALAADVHYSISQSCQDLHQRRYQDVVASLTETLGQASRPQDICDALRHRADAHLCLKQYPQAIDDYTEAIRLTSPPTVPTWNFYHRASAHWMAGHHDKAAADYRDFHRLWPRHLYSQARLFLVLRDQARILASQGRASEAERAIQESARVLDEARSDAAEYRQSPRPDEDWDWRISILDCLAGQISPESLVAAATSRPMPQRCEGYYYAGEACLLRGSEGDDKAAIRWFTECKATEIVFDTPSVAATPMSEYHLAVWRLDQLTAKAQTQPATRPE